MYPLSDVSRNGLGANVPWHLGGIGLKVGVILGFTGTVNCAVVPHSKFVGVNVYVVVVELFNAGDQVPTIPFNEVVGSAVVGNPKQNGTMGANVGNDEELFTIIVSVIEKPHCPGFGVNV